MTEERIFQKGDPITFIDGTYKGCVGLFQNYTDCKAWVYNTTKSRSVNVHLSSIAPFRNIRSPKIPTTPEEAVKQLKDDIVDAIQQFNKLGFSADQEIVNTMVNLVASELDNKTTYVSDYDSDIDEN
jgi:hypothetical protein